MTKIIDFNQARLHRLQTIRREFAAIHNRQYAIVVRQDSLNDARRETVDKARRFLGCQLPQALLDEIADISTRPPSQLEETERNRLRALLPMGHQPLEDIRFGRPDHAE